jgi:hypothetical protein
MSKVDDLIAAEGAAAEGAQPPEDAAAESTATRDGR